jgi:hypothetical protein
MSTPSDRACVHSPQASADSLGYSFSTKPCTREFTQEALSASAILNFQESHAMQLLVQEIPAGKRRNNRVILGFRRADGEHAAAGGATIRHAVARAQIRMSIRSERSV